jgi:Tol biopolymer transport system component
VELITRVAPAQVSDTAEGSGPRSIARAPFQISLSADGRYVAFLSPATNLVPSQDDRNGRVDAFLRDRIAATTLLVSRAAASATAAANLGAAAVAVSPDGRYVAWSGQSTDVVAGQPGGTNPPSNVFLFDRVAGTNRLLGPGSAPVTFSRDGRFLLFLGNLEGGAFLYDLTAKTLSKISSTATDTGHPVRALSQDGRYAVFVSAPLGTSHIQVFDRVAGTTEEIGIGYWPAISADGRYVVFLSAATNLVPGQVDANEGLDAFLYDRVTRTTTLVSHAPGSSVRTGDLNLENQNQYPALSADGRYVAFVSPTPYQSSPPPRPVPSLILFDRATGAVKPVALFYSSPLDSAVFSADGRSLVFTSRFDVLPGPSSQGTSNVFLYDLASERTTAITAGTAEVPFRPANDSYAAAISDDGRVVAFASQANDLVAGLKDFNEEEDVFAYTAPTGAIEAVTRRADPAATPARGSQVLSLSADGRWTAFMSASSHLISGQVDHQISIYNTARTDVFLYDAQTHTSQLVSHANGTLTTAGNDDSVGALLSGDGRYVAFVSLATNLTPEALPGIQNSNLFLFDRVAGTTTLVSRSLTGEGYVFAGPDAITPDGRFLAFTSNGLHLVPNQTPGTPHVTTDVFLYDRETGSLTLVSHSTAGPQTTGNDQSRQACLSADGRYVLFSSEAGDLVPGQTGPAVRVDPDVFLYDRVTGVTTLVSHTRASGTEASGKALYASPALSADGRYAVFTSPRGDLAADATGNLFGGNIYLWDRATGASTLLLSVPTPGSLDNATLSADGRVIAVLGKGSLLPGQSGPTNQPQLFLYDRIAKTLTLASRAGGSATTGVDGGASDPALSADGRYVTFLAGYPKQLGPFGSSDVFRFDRVTGTTVLATPSRRSAGAGAGGTIQLTPLISADGQTLAFTSASPDLVEGDDNGAETDAFLFHADSAPPGPVAVPPCTLLDTHRTGPALRSNVRRSVKAAGTCGVPSSARSVVVKVTALQGTGKGNLQLFPGGSSTSAGILRFAKGQTRSASFTVAVGADGTIAILPFVAGNGTVQATVEVDAYNP